MLIFTLLMVVIIMGFIFIKIGEKQNEASLWVTGGIMMFSAAIFILVGLVMLILNPSTVHYKIAIFNKQKTIIELALQTDPTNYIVLTELHKQNDIIIAFQESNKGIFASWVPDEIEEVELIQIPPKKEMPCGTR